MLEADLVLSVKTSLFISFFGVRFEDKEFDIPNSYLIQLSQITMASSST